MRDELNISHPGYVLAIQEEAENTARARLDDAAFAEAWERGRKLTVDEAVALALGPPNPVA